MKSKPHLNSMLSRSIDEMISEIELDYRQQQASHPGDYKIHYGHLSRLVAIGLPSVPEDAIEFVDLLVAFREQLPDCFAKYVLTNLFEQGRDSSGVFALFRDARWQALGCPAVNVETRLAASLMLSECPPEMLEELRAPWGAFAIRLPEALIEHEGITYTHLMVHRFHSSAFPLREHLPDNLHSVAEKIERHMDERAGVKWGLYGMAGNQGYLNGEARLHEHLGRAPHVYLVEPEVHLGESAERVMSLFARLAIGVCLLANSEGVLRRKSTKKNEQGLMRKGKGPVTTEYVLGQKISVGFDCVDAVRTYVRGESRSLPAIQWVVRGHWRNQPIGPGRSERKRVWIMPHWKGPQDAPRLFREHEFKPSLTSPAELPETS